jgi:hypothetical protein
LVPSAKLVSSKFHVSADQILSSTQGGNHVGQF